MFQTKKGKTATTKGRKEGMKTRSNMINISRVKKMPEMKKRPELKKNRRTHRTRSCWLQWCKTLISKSCFAKR
jgi:hypothetical protein